MSDEAMGEGEAHINRAKCYTHNMMLCGKHLGKHLAEHQEEIACRISRFIWGDVCVKCKVTTRTSLPAKSTDAPTKVGEQISHVLIFSGEVPEVVLCTSLEDVEKRVGEAFLFDDELKEWFEKDLNSDDNWSFDESGNRFCFSIGIGEIETVTVYTVRQQGPLRPQPDERDGNTIIKALRTLGITTDSLFEGIRDDLERGLVNEARARLEFVDKLQAEAPASTSEKEANR